MIDAYLQWRGDSYSSSQHLIVKFEFPKTAIAVWTASEQEFNYHARKFCNDIAARELAGMSYYAAYDDQHPLLPAIEARGAEIYATLRRVRYSLTDAECNNIRADVIAHHAFRLSNNGEEITERLFRELEEWRAYVWEWYEL